MSRILQLSAAVLLSSLGCGGVNELGSEPEPLFHIEARFTELIPEPAGGFTNLRAGLMWAGVPVFVPYCFEYGTNPTKPLQMPTKVAKVGCRDIYKIVPGLMGPTVAVDPSAQSFRIPVTQLPSAEVLIGTLEQRMAYASIVVFDDLNGDRELDLSRGCGGFGGSSQPREPIYASSFTDLKERQTRLAYVEGPFNLDSFYYPHPKCSQVPPEGFSIWEVDGAFVSEEECSIHDIYHPVELTPATPTALRPLSCLQRDRESFPRAPRMQPPDEDDVWECTEQGALAVANPDCHCPEVRVFTLSGCSDDLECEKPEWDVRETPPEWWPCESSRP